MAWLQQLSVPTADEAAAGRATNPPSEVNSTADEHLLFAGLCYGRHPNLGAQAGTLQPRVYRSVEGTSRSLLSFSQERVRVLEADRELRERQSTQVFRVPPPQIADLRDQILIGDLRNKNYNPGSGKARIAKTQN